MADQPTQDRAGFERRAAPDPAVRLVELSHPISAGMTTYPGLPGPEIVPHLTREASRANYAPGTEFAIDRITMIGNTGTYLDSPYHRYADGVDLAGLPLEAVAALPAVIARLSGAERAFEVDPRPGAAHRRPVHRRPPPHPQDGHVSGPCLRGDPRFRLTADLRDPTLGGRSGLLIALSVTVRRPG